MNFYNQKNLPSNWQKNKLKYVINQSDLTSKNYSEEKVLSLTQNGIIERKIETNEGQVASSYEKYILVEPGDICMNPMDLLTGWVDISAYKGLISPAYYTFKIKNTYDVKFINYFFQSNYYRKTFFKCGKGVASHDNFGRWVLSLEELNNFIIYAPKSKEEQSKISKYIDEKINLINVLIKKIIEQKKYYILGIQSHLFETKIKKNNLVSNDKKWFKFIPKDWSITKLKNIFEIKSIKNNDNNQRLLSVTQDRGVVYRDEQEKNVVNPSGDLSAYKLAEPGDVIISLRSADGGFETSDLKGLVSPAYVVLKPKIKIDKNFYRYLLKSSNFIIEIGRFIKGIRDGKNIYFEDVKDIEIPYYPEEKWDKEYTDVINFHQNIVNTFKLMDKKIILLNKLKRSIISNTVMGVFEKKIL